jgi:type IV secretory pathway ATPase VirB11/archaellum biosynthesis ATPase
MNPESIIARLTKRDPARVPAVAVSGFDVMFFYLSDEVYVARVSADVEALRSHGEHVLASSESNAVNSVSLAFVAKPSK